MNPHKEKPIGTDRPIFAAEFLRPVKLRGKREIKRIGVPARMSGNPHLPVKIHALASDLHIVTQKNLPILALQTLFRNLAMALFRGGRKRKKASEAFYNRKQAIVPAYDFFFQPLASPVASRRRSKVHGRRGRGVGGSEYEEEG